MRGPFYLFICLLLGHAGFAQLRWENFEVEQNPQRGTSESRPSSDAKIVQPYLLTLLNLAQDQMKKYEDAVPAKTEQGSMVRAQNQLAETLGKMEALLHLGREGEELPNQAVENIKSFYDKLSLGDDLAYSSFEKLHQIFEKLNEIKILLELEKKEATQDEDFNRLGEHVRSKLPQILNDALTESHKFKLNLKSERTQDTLEGNRQTLFRKLGQVQMLILYAGYTFQTSDPNARFYASSARLRERAENYFTLFTFENCQRPNQKWSVPSVEDLDDLDKVLRELAAQVTKAATVPAPRLISGDEIN